MYIYRRYTLDIREIYTHRYQYSKLWLYGGTVPSRLQCLLLKVFWQSVNEVLYLLGHGKMLVFLDPLLDVEWNTFPHNFERFPRGFDILEAVPPNVNLPLLGSTVFINRQNTIGQVTFCMSNLVEQVGCHVKRCIMI